MSSAFVEGGWGGQVGCVYKGFKIFRSISHYNDLVSSISISFVLREAA